MHYIVYKKYPTHLDKQWSLVDIVADDNPDPNTYMSILGGITGDWGWVEGDRKDWLMKHCKP